MATNAKTENITIWYQYRIDVNVKCDNVKQLHRLKKALLMYKKKLDTYSTSSQEHGNALPILT